MSHDVVDERRKVAVGLAILVAGALLFALFFFGIIPKLLSGGGRTVKAEFATTGALHKGEPVRIDGVTVGKVKDIDVNEAGRGALVTMNVEDSAGDLYSNARATIRWRTLLGASFAVALDRGTPGTGDLGDRVIPQSRTGSQVELDDITESLTDDARSGMRHMFHELPQVFGDPDVPGRMLQTLGQSAPAIAKGFDALRGERPDDDIRELVANTGRAMHALDAPQGRLRALVQDAALTTQTTAARAGDLADTMTTAAHALPRVRATLASLDRTVAQVNPLLRRLQSPARDVAPAVAALQPVVSDADRLLSQKAQPLLRSLKPTASSLATTAREGTPLLDELSPSLERIDKHILPDLATRSPESKRTTYEMIGPALAGLDGIGSHYDDESTYIRFTGNGGGRILDTLPCRPFLTDPGSPALLQCQAFGSILDHIFGPTGAAKAKGRAKR